MDKGTGSKNNKRTVWQRLNALPWYVKSVQFWVVGFAATYVFVVLGFDERIAGVAGLIGINLVVFMVIAYLADQDDQREVDSEKS